MAACSPLVPMSYKDNANSRLTQSIKTEDATVWLRYMRSQYGYMIFDLEIANHSPFQLSVAPQQISFYGSSKPFVPLETDEDVHALSRPNSTLKMNRQFACAPSSVQRVYAEKANSKKAEVGLFAVLAIGAIVFDATQDSKDAHKETFTSKDASKSFGRDVMVAAAVAASDVAQSSAQQAAEDSYYLPFELFPECALESGNSIRGKIFLPRESYKYYVRVIIPIGDADYVFDFRRLAAKPEEHVPLMGARQY